HTLAVLPVRGHLRLVAVVDADVKRGPQGQGGGDEDAEQDGEELVDAAAAALDLVEAVEIEDHGPEHGDEREQQEVPGDGGHALGDGQVDGDEVGVEAKEVGRDPGQV